MRLTYTTPNGRMCFDFEAQTAKEAFELLARIQEVFEEPDCGLCESKNIRCDVRQFDSVSYYKLLCLDCGGQIDFGQNKDGTSLFLKRKGRDGQGSSTRGGTSTSRPAVARR
jgi:hypothetical protein